MIELNMGACNDLMWQNIDLVTICQYSDLFLKNVESIKPM